MKESDTELFIFTGASRFNGSSKHGLPSWSRHDFDTENPSEPCTRNYQRRNGILSTQSPNMCSFSQQTFESASASYRNQSLHQLSTRRNSFQTSNPPTISLDKSQCLESQPVTMCKSKPPEVALEEQSSTSCQDQDDDALERCTKSSAKKTNAVKKFTSSLVAHFRKSRQKPKETLLTGRYTRQISTQLASICEETFDNQDDHDLINSKTQMLQSQFDPDLEFEIADAFKRRKRPGESIVISVSSFEEESIQQRNETKKKSVYTLEEFLKLPLGDFNVMTSGMDLFNSICCIQVGTVAGINVKAFNGVICPQ